MQLTGIPRVCKIRCSKIPSGKRDRKDGCGWVFTCPIASTHPVGKQYDGEIVGERSLVKLHAGVWGDQKHGTHTPETTLEESRSTSVRRPVGSSQVEEWKDDEPLF